MTTLQVIYDGSLPSDRIVTSSVFKNAQFLLFDLPGEDRNTGVEVGFNLSIYVVSISLEGIRTLEKDVILPAQEFQGTLTSFSVIDIPREYSEAGYDLKCAFNSSISLERFKVYAITSSVTQESISNQVAELADEVNNIKADVAQIKQDIEDIKAFTEILTELIKTVIGVLV